MLFRSFLLGLACVLLGSYAFFLVVEKPSHQLARWVSSGLATPRRNAPRPIPEVGR